MLLRFSRPGAAGSGIRSRVGPRLEHGPERRNSRVAERWRYACGQIFTGTVCGITDSRAVGMGGKQSTVCEVSVIQTPVTESIQAAYKAGDTAKAQELIRLSCEEAALQVEKCQLLGIAAAYGDLQAVRYLLKEALVVLPTEPNDDNAAVVATYFGHKDVVKELLDSLRGPNTCQQLLNWMLAIACQQGHLDIVKLLIRAYSADPESCAVRRNEFPVLIRLPLYAAIKAGNEDVAVFLLRNGAFFCSYILMDSPESSKHLLRKYFIETSPLPGSAPAKTALCVNWSNLKLPWVDLDWLIDISCQITELDLSANCLVSLPSVIPWGLINLRKLSLADNQLTELPSVQSSDEIICTRLLEVDVSSNKLSTLPSGFLHLKNLKKLIAAKNYMEKLFNEENTTNWIGLRKLQEFDVSDNRNDEGYKTKRIPFFTTRSRVRGGPEAGPFVEFPAFLSDSLEVLYLNDNQLESVPQSVCLLKGLTELYLGNNPGIRELPPELGQLANLWQLDIEELSISNVPAEIRKEGPKTVLAYLRAQLRKAEKCKLMKMIVIGPPRQGKSTLIEILQTGKVPQMMHSDATIRTTKWELPKPVGHKAKVDSVEFNVWDIGGPASMSTVNQCFFTDKALYIVVWNLALGEEAVANLQFWLLNIEAKAPNSAVLVVGTHLDLIETKFRVERIATLRAYVLALCRSPSGSRATGFPDITFKHLHELSCKTLEGLDGLRQLIFHVTCNMKDVGSSICSQKLAGRLIPRSYLSLQEAVLAEQYKRSQNDDVQYLTDRQIELIIEQTPGNDIKDYEDLQTAINFLIETGTLLHFPDTSHGLRNLYFLDPVWLSECLQRIFNIKSSKSVAKNGVIRAEDLRMLLVGTGFTEQTEEQYFQFLAKFEIALPVANNSYLLPHLLPTKPALDIHGFCHQTTNTIQRVFKMSFVPVGFWQRFIARMLISLAEMDLQLFENKKNTKTRNKKVTIYSFTGTQRNRCSTFRVKRTHTVYWQEGLFVTFDGGYLSVESSDVNWKKKKSGGIKIICQSEVRDFSAMAFITDHVNSLIDQWFPALTATESDGTLLMEQYVPCHICATSRLEDKCGKKTEDAQYFNMEDCVLTAIELDYITCPNHPDIPVSLQELVPELFMTDFPASHFEWVLWASITSGKPPWSLLEAYLAGVRLFLENSKLECSENENNVLGQGGSGTVIYRARYQGKPVAVKRFQIKKCSGSPTSAADTMLKHLRAMDAMKNFSEFRQEASMLHSLQHPCIVSLIGISIHPLCFALELAPLGSLTTVLSENSKVIALELEREREQLQAMKAGCSFVTGSSFVPLGHMLTHKIAYQIVTGLAYLHKKNIIFCDLKSDNILVWSLDVKEHINIKLSDYGISRQSFHEGALGVEGTPGYQAPEIRPRIVYDEKVDMFSYGMVLYELLSGQRPVLGQHQLQIAKKLSKGIRPVLGQPEEVQLYRLQALMMECWDTKPEKRPLAISVVGQMKDPTFATFMYLLPCGKQSSFFCSQGQEYTVVFWDGKEDTRNYTVVNPEKGVIEVERMSCPGMRLCCQLKFQNALWAATEDQKISVYRLQGMCPLKAPQKGLDSPAAVSCFLVIPVVKKNSYMVLAGMSDGLVAVFSVAQGIPADTCSYLCSHTANRSKFNIADDDPRQNPYPVRAMEIANSGTEVWYSNGPGVLVIDCAAMEISRRLEPFSPPSAISSIACNSECHGEEVVWCLDEKSNFLVMYHAATYQLCARYFCGDCSPLRDMFAIQQPATAIPATAPINHGALEGNSLVDMSIIYSPEVGTQILNHQDSLTDYCSVSSYSSSPPNRLTRCPSSLPSSPTSSSSAPLSTDFEESDKFHELKPSPDHDAVPTGDNSQHLQAVKILPVKDLIWIPRRGGDIIVIGLEKESGMQRGRVIAVLKAGELAPYGTLVDAALVAKDTVVCCFQNENTEWCLAVWRGWSARDFDVFYQAYEELGRLETCMRKRR
ncbi:hypothetical protein ASZ78_003427 [Callipepla squamata]|uniref:non-specific serine/threonine protein kinase n=1 Tax=Callipepla squamata TaxID=9009 RepID=A0A226NNG9_CALSU|nr:hypothetical protein ASZ78_003427 [Callipepla squamata]